MNREEKARVVHEAADAIEAMARGTVLPHKVLGEMLGHDRGHRGYYGMVGRLRYCLLGRRILLGCRVGFGYVVLPDDEARSVPDWRMKVGESYIRRAAAEYAAIAETALSDRVAAAVDASSRMAGEVLSKMWSKVLRG